MKDLLDLEIITPTGTKVKAQVTAVSARAENGEFEALPLHLPMIANLKPGVVHYTESGTRHVAAISAGFAEIGPNHVTILTDLFLAAGELNVEQAQQEVQSAEKELKDSSLLPTDPEYFTQLRLFDWAQAKLDAAREAAGSPR